MASALTVQEAAVELRCSRSAVYVMCAEGRLRHYRIGKAGIRIPADAVQELMAGEQAS